MTQPYNSTSTPGTDVLRVLCAFSIRQCIWRRRRRWNANRRKLECIRNMDLDVLWQKTTSVQAYIVFIYSFRQRHRHRQRINCSQIANWELVISCRVQTSTAAAPRTTQINSHKFAMVWFVLIRAIIIVYRKWSSIAFATQQPNRPKPKGEFLLPSRRRC